MALKFRKHKIGIVERLVDTFFEKLKARFIRPNGPKQYRGNWNWENSLEAIYTAALQSNGLKFKDETYEKLARIATGYIDATKEKTKAQVIKAVEDSVNKGNTDEEIANSVKSALEPVIKQSVSAANKIVASEINAAKNIGIVESIDEIAVSMGEEDPNVAFIGPLDKDTCPECKRLYFVNGTKTPRVWKKSELNPGYHKKGNAKPSLLGSHPFCRHTLVLIPRGFGFKNDKLDYIGLDHDEWVHQNS